MKQLLFSFFLILSVAASAQTDSSKLKVPITLEYEQMCVIAACMGDWGMPNRISFAYEVADSIKKFKATDSTMTDSVVYNHPVKVYAESSLIVQVFEKMSHEKEGIVKDINKAMETAIFPQVMNHSWIVSRILEIKERNGKALLQLVQRGNNFFTSIKK